MRYKAVIFDLDGTLVDTLEDIAASMNYALDRLGFEQHSVESYKWRVGNGSSVMASRSLPADRQELGEEALALQQAYYGEHFCDHSRPYPGMVGVLGELKRRGVKLAVLSNKPDGNTQQVIGRCFKDGIFDTIRGVRPEVPLKPDPAGALAIAAELGVQAGETALVGDTAMDMQTGVRAGMFRIGVTWGFRDRAELLENGAQVLVDRAEELLGLLLE